MEIKLVTGATAYEATKNVLSKIDTKNFDFENIVVVPDAFSMQAESLIFDMLGIKSTFNIEVVGISRLAGKLLRDNNIGFKRISSLEEVFCVYKAMQKSKQSFKYFKSINVELCMKILQIIKQFKGCKIAPQQIKNVGDENLDKKMGDLKLIYENYELLLAEKLDLSKLLKFFVENAKKSLNLSKINLFFANFDSFSAEISSFICELIPLVNSIYIGMAKPISLKNSFIFEDDILKKISSFAKENKITVQVENIPTKIVGSTLNIVENLFGFDIDEKKSDFFVNVVAKNRYDEVEYVAKYIKYQIYSGNKFKDFSIAVPDKNYIDIIKNIFSDYDITFYSDDAVNLSQTLLGRFLFKLIEIAKVGFNRQSFEFLASSDLAIPDEKVVQDLYYLCIEDEKEFVDKFPAYTDFVNQIKRLKLCKKLKEFVSVLIEILEKSEENHKKILENLQKNGFFKEESENLQTSSLILKVLDKLIEIGGDEEFSIFDFENLLKFSFESVKVETIPSYIDAVYVGDATDSYFEDKKFMFVLGATSNLLPRTRADLGIIDDTEIKKLRFEFALEPEIRVLNRRNRLKLFEALQHAKEKLIVTTPINDDGQKTEKANFVEDLIKIFGKNVVHTSAMEEFNVALFTPEEELERLLFLIGHIGNLSHFYTKFKETLPKKYVGTIKNLIKNTIPVEKNFETFKNFSKFNVIKSISASQLETFFACPFKYFMNYVLRISARENIQPTHAQFGTLQHNILQIFMTQFSDLKDFKEKQIDEFLNKNLEVEAKKVYDNKVLQPAFLRYLRNESKIILKNVIKEQNYSEFRPLYYEKQIKLPFEGIYFNGRIDRVDVCGDYFRIIDYKTGNTGTLKTELFYGKKLQLFLYADAMEKQLHKKCAGVYYFDCKTKYIKQGTAKNLLHGLTLKDEKAVVYSDKRLALGDFKSDITGIATRSNPKKGEFIFKGSNLDLIEDKISYAVEISKQAVKEIKDGYFAVKPFADECDLCPYISICKHCDVDGYRKILKN